jgi:nucleoside-diphosphate-sugar epimerase
LHRLPGPIRVVAFDVRDAAGCRAALKPLAPEIVFHLAGFTDNRRDPSLLDDAMATNVHGTLNVVRALDGAPLRAFVHAGTGEEYGRGSAPFREDHPLDPVSPYSASKASVFLVLRTLFLTSGFPAATARLFMPYGEGLPRASFVAQCLEAVRSGAPLRMTKGAQTRDYVHIDDVVEALLRIALARDLLGEAVNVGTGVETSLRDVAATLAELCQGRLRYETGKVPYRRFEVMRSVADVTLLRERLGWTPAISLRDGLSRLVRSAALVSEEGRA